MTEKEAIKALSVLPGDYPEEEHEAAEGILCDFLEENGFADLVLAFLAAKERVPFWYD
jgi:hypothetical protein